MNGTNRETDDRQDNDRADTRDLTDDISNAMFDLSFSDMLDQIRENARNAVTFGGLDIGHNIGPIGRERNSTMFSLNNGIDGQNCWSEADVNGGKEGSDGRPPLRPIIKTSFVPRLIETSAPSSDWYNQYVNQTKRFEVMNALTNAKHVRFESNESEGGSPEKSTERGLSRLDFGSLFTPLTTMPDIGFRFSDQQNFSVKNEDRGPPGFGPLPNNEPQTSLVDSFYNGAIRPAANSILQEEAFFRSQWDNAAERIRNSLVNSPLLGDTVWSAPASDTNSFLRFFVNSSDNTPSNVQQLLNQFRRSIPKTPPNYTWSGQLPRKSRTKTPIYSCKVFLGGIPYDLTDSDLHCTFAQFGHIQIQWPGKDIKSAIDGAAANKAGYVYIIFESYDNVAALLNNCTVSYRDMDSGCRWYFNISSRRQKGKEVQVIPFDIGDRFYMKSSFSGQMEHSRTVFVGALHGMLSADGLAKVMDDLFGGVVFAGLDTDKFKYPLGSGRVSFDNQDSYLKAVTAAFVEIKSARFKKKIQIDPYIESESMCAICRVQQSNPIFCRDDFIYFCAKCWDVHHSNPEASKHRPIIKNKPNA